MRLWVPFPALGRETSRLVLVEMIMVCIRESEMVIRFGDVRLPFSIFVLPILIDCVDSERRPCFPASLAAKQDHTWSSILSGLVF